MFVYPYLKYMINGDLHRIYKGRRDKHLAPKMTSRVEWVSYYNQSGKIAERRI